MPNNNEDQAFIKKIDNAKNKALNNGSITLLKFLNPHEQDLARTVFKKNDEASISFFGGFQEAEYQRALISPYEEKDFKITTLKIEYNHKFLTLNHKNILGSVLALGISRDVIGDIIFFKNDPYFFVTEEISTFIIEEFNYINGKPIKCLISKISPSDIHTDYEEDVIITPSMRLDAVIANALSISRQSASEFIINEMVKVNFRVTQNTSHQLKENDLLSIRTKGRIKIIKINGETKKGNLALCIGRLQ